MSRKRYLTRPGIRRLFSTGQSNKTPPISIQRPQPWSPSLRTSLTLVAATFTGVSSYSAYKVGYCGESVFLPLWFVSKERAPLRSELNRDIVIEQIKEKLHNRLSVDEEVHFLLGVPVSLANDDKDEYSVYVRSSVPGLKGVTVDPTWSVSWTARPFQSSSGIDRLLQPFTPGQADSEDATADPNRSKSGLPYYEAVVDGTVHVNAPKCPPNTEAKLHFRALLSLDTPKEGPRFVYATLTMTDLTTNDTVITRRLF